jgi:MFS family permease
MSDQIFQAATVRRPQPNFRVIAMIVASAMFMEQLDATVLATALPTMARDFGVSAPSMSIALTSYLLSLAIFIPASGLIADRFGSRTVFRSAIAVFIVGSIFCALSPNLLCLVLARLLQGLGGAMMMPVGRLVLLRSVARKDMVNAMSWLLVPALIGPILGPPVGGLIVTYLDWRWIFYINVPVGIIGFIWCRSSSRISRARRRSASIPSASSSRASRSARCCSASNLQPPGRGDRSRCS